MPFIANSALRAAAWCEYMSCHVRSIHGLVDAAKVTTARMMSCQPAESRLNDGFIVRDIVREQWSGVITAMPVETENGWGAQTRTTVFT